MTKTPLQPAGTQKKCKPSEAGTKVVKKNLFYVDPANPRPVPVWDNEWRQEADNRLREPIMSGIMRGVYYTYNTYSPSARTPRQEMDLKLQKPITTLTVEGRYFFSSMCVSVCLCSLVFVIRVYSGCALHVHEDSLCNSKLNEFSDNNGQVLRRRSAGPE